MNPVLAERALAVAIVEDRATIRDGISWLIDATSGFRCSGSFRSMEEALPSIESNPPDVVLVDLVLPGVTSIDGIRRLSARHPELPLLVFSVYEDDARVCEALRSGACGCLSKKTSSHDFLRILRGVAAGGAGPTSPDAACHLRDILLRSDPPEGMVPPSRGEIRLLSLLADGHNYETAADALGGSVRDVTRLARRAYRRLHAYARAGRITAN